MKTTLLAILALVLMSETSHAKRPNKIKHQIKYSSDSDVTSIQNINLEDMKDINTTSRARERARR